MLMEDASLSLKSLEGILERAMLERTKWLLNREGVLEEIGVPRGPGGSRTSPSN